ETYGLSDVSRHAEDFSSELHGQPGGDQRPAVLRAFHDHYPEGQTGHDPVAHWKILRRRMRAQWKFADDRPALQHFFVQFLVFLRVANVDARAEDSNGAAIGIHRSLMPDGVNSTRHAADDDQPARGQFASETLSHLRAVESRPPCADDAEAREIQNLRVAANVKQYRRVVDLQKRLRIFRLRPVQERAACNLLYAR